MGRKRSIETNFSKVRYLPGEKKFWPIVSRVFGCDDSQGAVYKGP